MFVSHSRWYLVDEGIWSVKPSSQLVGKHKGPRTRWTDGQLSTARVGQGREDGTLPTSWEQSLYTVKLEQWKTMISQMNACHRLGTEVGRGQKASEIKQGSEPSTWTVAGAALTGCSHSHASCRTQSSVPVLAHGIWQHTPPQIKHMTRGL